MGGKVIKKLLKILLIVLIVVLFIPTSVWFAIQNSRVQNYFVELITSSLEQTLGTRIEIGNIDIAFFNRVVLNDVFVSDLNADTLLSAQRVSASFLGYSPAKRHIKFHRIEVTNSVINLLTDSLGVMNLVAFVDALTPPDTEDEDREKPAPIVISTRNVRLINSDFRMQTFGANELDHLVNFDNLRIFPLDLDARNLAINGDTISLTIFQLAGEERSGLKIDNFRTDFTLCSNFFAFERLRLQSMGARMQLPSIRLEFDGYSQLSDFINSVTIVGEIEPSLVTTQLLSYFVPGITSFREELRISGNLKGTISDLRIRDLSFKTKENTSLLASINLMGLPDIETTFIVFNIESFTTSTRDITSIFDYSKDSLLIQLPDEVMTLGNISYRGSFTGFISDFVAFGSFTTDVGNISLDASIKPNREEGINVGGSVRTDEFNMGKLLNSDMFGRVSLEASMEGSLSTANEILINTEATVTLLEANGYSYSNLKLSGSLTNKTYEGTVFFDDPNLKLNFLGRVDLSDSIPVFDFSAFVPRADLVAINLNTIDSISQASFLLTAKFQGNTLDNSSGEIKVMNSMYKNQNGELKTSDITIFAHNTEDSKVISLTSEFADAELRGKYNYANIGRSLTQLMYIYLPALSPDNQKPKVEPTGVENPEYNDYIIRLRLKKTRKFTDVLAPQFRIAENTNVFGIYNPDFQTLNLKIKIPEILISGNLIKDISIDGQTLDSSFMASITIPQLDAGGVNVGNIVITANAQDNRIASSIAWNNRQQVRNMGEINVLTSFVHPDSLRFVSTQVNLLSSSFYLNDIQWNINPATIRIDSTRVNFTDIVIKNNSQSISIGGMISSSPSDSITLAMENIDLSNLNLYTQGMGYQFTGHMNGFAMVSNFHESMALYADIEAENVGINGNEVGQLILNSNWFSDENRISLRVANMIENDIIFEANGDLFTESNKLDIKALIHGLPLKHLEPIIKDEIYDLAGNISGDIKISGTTNTPKVNGTLFLNNTAATINFTKTRYTISEPIYLVDSDIFFRDFKLTDAGGRLAILNGSIRTDYFRNISMNLNLAPNNFQFMNTTERDNDLFYGNVFVTGQVLVLGTLNNLSVNASVRTDPRTAIFLPLSSSSDVTEHNFVSFVSSNPDIIIIEESFNLVEETKSNLSLTLNLDVTPEAEVQIIIDKKLGDIIRANGAGKLKMEINPSKDVFQMFGDYVIESGDYLFTLMDVINKRFRVAPGGSITWGGDVTDANMNIDAIYSVRTPLNQLLLKDDERYKRRTNVECNISLSGKLMEPDIKFSINVPDADPETRAEVQAALNTEESINTQFISLLVISSFTPPGEMMAKMDRSVANTGSELLSNQMSNLLSQWSDALDIGFNYRPGDPNNELTSTEVELALSTRFLNDRVSINGNVDMGGQTNSAGIAGDFNVDVKLNPSGKIRMKAFARSNDDYLQITQTTGLTGGAGVVFREDFNSFGELFTRIRAFFRPKEVGIENEEEKAEG